MEKSSQTIETLPYDILYIIVSFLSILDIVRIRQVCKHFQRLVIQRTVWSDAYKRCSLLRPPGPLASQSAQDLERLLAYATRLDRRLNSPSPKPVFRRILATPFDINYVELILGRYLVVGSRKLTFYDLDAGADDFHVPIFVYDGENNVSNSSMFSRCSITQTPGADAFVAVMQVEGPQLIEDDEVVFMIHVFKISQPTNVQFIAQIPVNSILRDTKMAISHNTLVLYTCTRQDSGKLRMFTLPPRDLFDFRLDLLDLRCYLVTALIMTPTHVLLFRTNPRTRDGYLEAFPFPALSTIAVDRERDISSSHSGKTNDFVEPIMVNYTKDTSLGDIDMTFLALSSGEGWSVLNYFRVSLPSDRHDPSLTILDTRFMRGYCLQATVNFTGDVARLMCSVGIESRVITFLVRITNHDKMELEGSSEFPDEQLNLFKSCPFEGVRGRLCHFYKSEVFILDYAESDQWLGY